VESFLLGLPARAKLAVISIAGKYRTGKSFFVNRVLLRQRGQGFQVGSTIEACTKGLWIWLASIEDDPDRVTLLLDTEGFGGVDESVSYDSKIFIFALLLSSLFIFNSVGNIDEPALNTIDLVLNLARQIQGKASKRREHRFPLFFWVLRDFSLQMVDKDGHPLT
jgi:hypothetical protein